MGNGERWNPAHRMFRHLESQQDAESNNTPSVFLINQWSDVYETPLFEEPFIQRRDWQVWSDFDGVFNNPWHPNRSVGELYALRGIASHAERFHIVTARMPLPPLFNNIEGYYGAPFFSPQLATKLENFLSSRNPDCNVSFHADPKKFLRKSEKDTLVSYVAAALKEEKPVVLLASSIVDRWQFSYLVKELRKQSIQNLQLLFYLDTGHLFV